MSQTSEGDASVNDNDVEISNGGDNSETEADKQTTEVPEESAEVPNPIPSSEDSSQGAKKRKTKSEIWKHFKESERGKVQCIYYRMKYKCTRCEQGDSKVASSVWVNRKWDPMKHRELLAKMIISHELPFMFSEYTFFNMYMKYSNPLYQKVSRTTIKKECINVVESERDVMKKVFKNVDMVSLTFDCWASNQTIGFMCITAHYIDSEWNLQKRIISLNDLPPPRSGDVKVISDAISETIMKLGIENKLGTITLDNVFNDDKGLGPLKLIFEAHDKLHFLGYFFRIRCCAQILNLVVQDGLRTIKNCLYKIRKGVKYLKKSRSRLVKFGEIATQLGISTKRSLCTDVETRWNSTHYMLDRVIHYKKAFKEYALRNPNFEWLPNEIEWGKAEKVCKLLGVFCETTKIFSRTSHPTSNLLLVEIFKVKKAICDYMANDVFTQETGVAMYAKFEKYWGEVNVLMAIASILDPRLKMVSIKFVYKRLYSGFEVESHISEVMEKLRALYDLYAKKYIISSSSAGFSSGPLSSSTADNRLQNEFWKYLESTWSGEQPNSDLDNYLKESIFQHRDSGPFDVLKWWKTNTVRYPILSKLARDILCIPISTVASKSAFSSGDRVLDDYRSCFKEDIVENLV